MQYKKITKNAFQKLIFYAKVIDICYSVKVSGKASVFVSYLQGKKKITPGNIRISKAVVALRYFRSLIFREYFVKYCK